MSKETKGTLRATIILKSEFEFSQQGIVNKVWMKLIEITSTNRNATERISDKYKTNPVEHK